VVNDAASAANKAVFEPNPEFQQGREGMGSGRQGVVTHQPQAPSPDMNTGAIKRQNPIAAEIEAELGGSPIAPVVKKAMEPIIQAMDSGTVDPKKMKKMVARARRDIRSVGIDLNELPPTIFAMLNPEKIS
jgi:stage V sporulation protein SpoVS